MVNVDTLEYFNVLICSLYYIVLDFPGGTRGKKKNKKQVANVGDIGDVDSTAGLKRSPGQGNDNTLECAEFGESHGFLPGEVHGQRSPAGYSP